MYLRTEFNEHFLREKLDIEVYELILCEMEFGNNLDSSVLLSRPFNFNKHKNKISLILRVTSLSRRLGSYSSDEYHIGRRMWEGASLWTVKAAVNLRFIPALPPSLSHLSRPIYCSYPKHLEQFYMLT